MKELQLFLIPQPGSKPEFLANLQPTDNNNAGIGYLWNKLPDKIVLEGYTRDGWAWKPGNNNNGLTSVSCRSVDGRNKLPGFVGYLKQRQKSAFGRFAPTGVWIISYLQKDKNNVDCRIAMDLTSIPNCNLRPIKAPVPPISNRQRQGAAVGAKSSKKGGGGLLGKLVGAQHRTNHHVAVANAKPRRVAAAAPAGEAAAAGEGAESSSSNGDAAAAAAAAAAASAAAEPTRTAGQVLADFRQAMQDKMLDFDLNSDEVLRVNLNINEHTAGLSEEDKSRVTMEILKYMVYEAAEEVNEEWVAHKEPSEFLDETVICVYKEGAAPPEVLEEVNAGELPDEIVGQQKAAHAERQRQADQAEARAKRAAESAAHAKFDQGGDDQGLEALNANKRDRRTMEEYQRERDGGDSSNKRGRV